MSIDLGRIIKTLRLAHKLTQEELVGNHFSITYLSRVENNDIKPSETFINHILNRLGYNLSDLDFKQDEERIKAIFDRFRNHPLLTTLESSYLIISTNLSFAPTIYLKTYSMLIRHFTLLKDLTTAFKLLDKSQPFINEFVDEDTLAYGCKKGIKRRRKCALF